MTDQQLRDLLRERVADVTMPDVSERAWRAGQRARRRDLLVVVGCAAVVTAGVAAGVAVLSDGHRSTGPAPAPVTPSPSTSASPNPSSTPDGFLGELPVYLAPTLDQEPALPLMRRGRPPLPEVIDVEEPPASGGEDAGVYALAALRVGGRTDPAVVLLSPDGEYWAVDTSRLSPVGDVHGNLHDPETAHMLAPGGGHLAFPQSDHLMLFDVAGGVWSRHDLPPASSPYEFVTWLDRSRVLVFGDSVAARVDVTTGQVTGDDPARWPAPTGLGRKASYYSFPVRSVDGGLAQSWFAGRKVTGLQPPLGPPEVLTVDGDETVAAAFPDSAPASAASTRSLGCCPAATWLAPGVPGYLSFGDQTRLIAWYAGTDRFERVTEIVGATGAISFADLSR